MYDCFFYKFVCINQNKETDKNKDKKGGGITDILKKGRNKIKGTKNKLLGKDSKNKKKLEPISIRNKLEAKLKNKSKQVLTNGDKAVKLSIKNKLLNKTKQFIGLKKEDSDKKNKLKINNNKIKLPSLNHISETNIEKDNNVNTSKINIIHEENPYKLIEKTIIHSSSVLFLFTYYKSLEYEVNYYKSGFINLFLKTKDSLTNNIHDMTNMKNNYIKIY